MRKWFSSEFTWRLYVVLQGAAIITFVFLVLDALVNGDLLEYRTVYEEAKIDPVAVAAKCAHLSDDPKDNHTNFPPRPSARERGATTSPREDCLQRESRPRVVGGAVRRDEVQRHDPRPDLAPAGLGDAVRCGAGTDLARGELAQGPISPYPGALHRKCYDGLKAQSFSPS
jgi:hypothetical protein